MNTIMWIILIAMAAICGYNILSSILQSRARKTSVQIVTTVHDNPSTSRAFTWHSRNPNSRDAQLQITKGNVGDFEHSSVTSYEANHSALRLEGQDIAVHRVVTADLKPSTMYSYRVRDSSEGDWSEPHTFTTAAEEISEVSFIYVTDSQADKVNEFRLWENTMKQAFARFANPDFVVHAGDLVETAAKKSAWSHFFNASMFWIGKTPIVPVVGNNDIKDIGAARYASYFHLPENGAEALKGTQTNYSFDYGCLHIAVLNTEKCIKQQTKWLEADLAGTHCEWKIMVMHRPIYGGTITKKLVDWSRIIDKYKVDLVLQGHNHVYSRSHPVKNGRVTGDGSDTVRDHEGAIYVVVNASGPKFNKLKEDQFYHKLHFQNKKQIYAGISISGKTLTYQAYDVDGQLLDQFTIQH
ncbi:MULTISPECIES: purple acid phosphatase family protein [Paenibacillus]|uniref:Metallophosphoesterase family protein n=1 Tax=Paenibacillus urinalis TaxID=521520 RepID=A0AAX3MSN1_9BACL|nr:MULTISPECIES: metallophosphoesterase family protein [Paenibacillus]WDH80396.1 metallophosphoesterase family protein [Paenibacillus urinalis]